MCRRFAQKEPLPLKTKNCLYSLLLGEMMDTVIGATLPVHGKTVTVGATPQVLGEMTGLASGAIPRQAGETMAVGAILLPVGGILTVGATLAVNNLIKKLERLIMHVSR